MSASLTSNAPDEVAFAEAVVRETLGDRWATLAQPIGASEDFSEILQLIPGAFLFVGAVPPGVDPATAPLNHSPKAVFDDAVLADSARTLAALAQRRLV